MRPTVEDLQAIWRFIYSRASLLQAAEFFAELDNVVPESIQGRALIEMTLIAYARPFTGCLLPPKGDKLIPLDDVSPPQHLAKVHREMLKLRNTVIGHKDATATQNVVKVEIIHPPRVTLNVAMVGGVWPPLKSWLDELCNHFVKHCDDNLHRLNKTHRAEFMKHPPGQYQLVISEPPADWLTPFQTKHGEDFRV